MTADGPRARRSPENADTDGAAGRWDARLVSPKALGNRYGCKKRHTEMQQVCYCYCKRIDTCRLRSTVSVSNVAATTPAHKSSPRPSTTEGLEGGRERKSEQQQTERIPPKHEELLQITEDAERVRADLT